MQTLLLFPPGWHHLQLPYLALPCLTAYLKAQGCRVEQRDLNIAFFHHLCRHEVYQALYEQGRARFWQLNRQPSLSAIGQAAYADLAWMVLQPPQSFYHRLLGARDDLQSENFYHIASCWSSVRTVNDLWGIVRAIQVGLRLTEGGAPVQYPEESSVEVRTAVEQAPGNLHWSYYEHELLPTLNAYRPDWAGISISDPGQLIPALTLGRFLKEKIGIGHVTIGGNVPTRLRSLWPQRPELFAYFDSVVLYEGEGPLLALIEALSNGDDLSRVPNLVYRQGENVYVNELARPVPVDRLPAPDFEGIVLRDYLVPEPVLPVQASRGCYWGRCAFCNFDKGVSQYQAHAPEQVVNHLRALVARYDVHIFSFVDDALLPWLTKALADHILAAGLDIVWEGSARFDRGWTATRCQKIAQAGCRTLSFGLESANRRMLRLMKKGTGQETILEVLKNCAEAGIINRVSLFFGFPGETLDEAKETQNFVLSHGQLIHGVDSQRYTISRCSPVAQDPAQFGVVMVQDDGRDMALRHYAYQTQEGMSRAESRALSLQLYRETQARHPHFALTYYPLLLYTYHFGTSAPLTLIEQSRRAYEQQEESPPTPPTEPRLRPDITCATLAYDLTAIRHQLNEGYEEVEPIRTSETQLLIDVGERRVYSVSPLAAFVLQTADGTRSHDSIVAATAERFGLAPAQAVRKCNALFHVYKNLLLYEPGKRGIENAYRVSVSA